VGRAELGHNAFMDASILSALGLVLIIIIVVMALVIGLVVRTVRGRRYRSGGPPPPA